MTSIDRIDPLRSRNAGFLLASNLMYEPLFSLDQVDRPFPRLCTATEQSSDDLTWNLTLRDDILFHDGTAFDSEDAVSSARLWVEQGTGALHDALAVLSPIFEPIDTRRLRIRLAIPEANLPWLLRFPIIPSQYAESKPSDPLAPVPGTGLFRISSYAKGIGLDLERVIPVQGKVEHIRLLEFDDYPSAMEAFHSDALDIVPLDEEEYRILELRKGVRIARYNGVRLVYAALGTTKPRTLSNPTARSEVLARLQHLMDSDEFSSEFCVFSSERGMTAGFGSLVFGESTSPSPTPPAPTSASEGLTWKSNLEVLAAKGSFEAGIAAAVVLEFKSHGIPAVQRILEESECVDALLNGRYDVAIRPLPLPVVPGGPVLDSKFFPKGSPYPFPLIRSGGILVGPRVFGNLIPCASEIYRGIEETWVWSGS